MIVVHYWPTCSVSRSKWIKPGFIPRKISDKYVSRDGIVLHEWRQKRKKPHINITLRVRSSYGHIYTGETCNFGVRRVNTNVSLDNNIPVGLKPDSGVNDHTILNFSMVFRDDLE